MRLKILATISMGFMAAACQGTTYSQNAPSAANPYYGNSSQASAQACADYGFQAGTSGFGQCVSREQAARASGRVGRDYAPAQMTVDARNACTSYGLAMGTPSYDRCVSREMNARTDQTSGVTPASTVQYRTDQYGYRVDAQDYRVDANGYRMATPSQQSYPNAGPNYGPNGQPYASQQVFRDEYGNRYDSQGNRVDANGRVMAVPASRY